MQWSLDVCSIGKQCSCVLQYAGSSFLQHFDEAGPSNIHSTAHGTHTGAMVKQKMVLEETL